MSHIITIDGPAGAGKGTIGFYLADRLGFQYLDTGLLYRALALMVLQEGVDPSDTSAVIRLASLITLAHTQSDQDLRNEDVASYASKIGVIPEVRAILNEIQRNFANHVQPPFRGAILDGRDIGTVVCPKAPCKLFITAHPDIRTKRRLLESYGPQYPQELILQKIQERDARDAQRPVAPLAAAPDAQIIDTSDLSIEAACAQAEAYARFKLGL